MSEPQHLVARTLQHYPDGAGQAEGVEVKEVDHSRQTNSLAQEVAEVSARCSMHGKAAEGQAGRQAVEQAAAFGRVLAGDWNQVADVCSV